jgi:ribosomal-protein-alanine N-acetyltransferase
MSQFTIPTIKTERLLLRPFQLSDAKDVQREAGRKEIADTTASIPHPYPDGAAEAWISKHPQLFAEFEGLTLAIIERDSNHLVGCIGLFDLSKEHLKAEIGYWISVAHWNKGYCSEATQAVFKYAFTELGLNRIISRHMSHNPASGKVMMKCGMKKEGYLRQDSRKNGKFVDLETYGILKEEFVF